jgi:hypothetical protein
MGAMIVQGAREGQAAHYMAGAYLQGGVCTEKDIQSD